MILNIQVYIGDLKPEERLAIFSGISYDLDQGSTGDLIWDETGRVLGDWHVTALGAPPPPRNP